MPKNSSEVVFKPIVLGEKLCHFFSLFALKCPALICASTCELQNGLGGFLHVWVSGSHWFRVHNSWQKKLWASKHKNQQKVVENQRFLLFIITKYTTFGMFLGMY